LFVNNNPLQKTVVLDVIITLYHTCVLLSAFCWLMSWIFITLFTRARHCSEPEFCAQVCPILMLTMRQTCHAADINGRIDICTLHTISHTFHVLSRVKHLIVIDTCLPSINFTHCNNVTYTVIKTMFVNNNPLQKTVVLDVIITLYHMKSTTGMSECKHK
jgi:hypothetical protein